MFFLKDPKQKYRNIKTNYKGIKYDSKKEAEFAHLLDVSMDNDKVSERVVKIVRQPKFILQERFTDKDGNKHRAINYVADFEVKYADGRIEIIDVKGMKTEVYKIKKKLFLKKYPELDFREV